MRVAIAAALGVCSFFLLFTLGEGLRISPSVSGAEHLAALLLTIGMGAYFLICTYLLSRGIPKGSGDGWVILALNAPLLLAAGIALLIEPNKLAAIHTLITALGAVGCSYAGAALGARSAGAR